MPANQYDGRQPEEKNSPEISRPIVQAETPSPDISQEPAQPELQRQKERQQEQSQGYGY